MLRSLCVLFLLLCGCGKPAAVMDAGTSAMTPPSQLPDGRLRRTRLRVQGDGAEVHLIVTPLMLNELHDAIARSGARQLQATGDMECLVIDAIFFDALVRGMCSEEISAPLWLGLPVRWHALASVGDASISTRAFPVLTELGPRGIVELKVKDAQSQDHQEFMLVPGEALVLVPGAGQWPSQEALPPMHAPARAMGWNAQDATSQHGLIIILPRYESMGS